MFFNRLQSIRKCRHTLKQYYTLFKKKADKLPKEKKERLEKTLKSLDQAILDKDKQKANDIIKQLEAFDGRDLKRSPVEYTVELVLALAFALVVAIVVRQVWFELYEIPTGSMRPTFLEKDRLTVSKTAFGLNVPLATKHFYFDPDLVQRTGVVIFSGDNIPLEDNMGNYFWIFPAYKRYIKRLIGKPGDAIYFYGGRLFGVDKEGNSLEELRTSSWIQPLDHVPILNFEGDMVTPNPNTLHFLHMHEPIGRITFSPYGEMKGEVNTGSKWVKDTPTPDKHDKIQTYSDLFGMRNYAMAKLLTKEQLEKMPGLDTSGLEEGVLYLELSHHPSLTYPKPVFLQSGQGVIPMLDPLKSIIPLQQKHLDAIMDHLYTSRIVVKNGKAKLYDVEGSSFRPYHPSLPGVPDGTYEFYNGKATNIHFAGVPTQVTQDNPLYKKTPENVQKLFNLGIEMHKALEPSPANPNHFPHRYAYFRDGDFYLMGGKVIDKDDPTLENFLEREEKRKERSTSARPYTPFKDYGPPLKEDGTYDVEFIRTFGVKVPENHYFVLGDNHARSADSRVFGFVPQENIEGAPSLIIWPPGDRIGPPAQKPYPFMNFPRAIVWTIALIIFAIWYVIHRRNMKKPLIK